MFKLPENKPQIPVDVPRNYFIYGETMAGKSYLANEFPNPLILNTDGNASANTVPSIQLTNEKDTAGKITNSIINQLAEILLALQTQNHTYETVVIDVIDDVIEMIKIAVANEFGVKSLSEIGYGKGYDYFNQAITELVIDLKALPMNVIYISRQITEYDDEGKAVKDGPSLKEKYVNLINGNCDLMIQARKIGNKYQRTVDRRRKAYKKEQIDDQNILAILNTIQGVFDITPNSRQQAKANTAEVSKVAPPKVDNTSVSKPVVKSVAKAIKK